MNLSQFKQVFIDEASGLLVSLDNVLIELEKDPANSKFINEAFRIMHTIKGAGGMYGFDHIVEITHEIESLFDVVRQTKSSVSQALINLTFIASDHLRELLADENFELKENIERQTIIKKTISEVRQQTEFPKVSVDSAPQSDQEDSDSKSLCTWNILFYPHDDIIKRAINLVFTFQDLFQLGEYRISNTPYKSNNQLFWSIILVTNQPYDEIESALLFVMDYCKISKIADFNIFDPTQLDARQNKSTPKNIVEIIKSPDSTPEVTEKQSQSFRDTPPEEKFGQSGNIQNSAVQFENQSTSRINVDAAKLDELMYLVSELVTTKSGLILDLERQDYEKARESAEKIEKLSNLLSENALNIRLVSLQEMLSRFKRLIRDLSKHLNKEVTFDIIGQDIELDKNIIDNIGEPLMHLIRNCIDHGIESLEIRKSQNKPAIGTIKLEATKTGNNVFISISDDGKGIDLEYLYNKAIEKGFVAPNTQLSDSEILDLIFLPGFSTAQSLTDISGRGVGMDIVKKKVQDIRGAISVSSQEGVGTVFTLKLQQSISIIETLLIEADGLTYAIPIEDIDACILEPSENFLNKNSHQIGYNGQLIPYICLRENFSSVKRTASITEKIIIINRLNKRYAIVAENIIGEYQAVIKPLGEAFDHLKFLSGASLLGDGSIALLIDTDKLWHEISASINITN